MDSKGHYKIESQTRKILKAHIKSNNNGKNFRLNALDLGNWLTDASQIYDPASYFHKFETARKYSNSIKMEACNIIDGFIKDLKGNNTKKLNNYTEKIQQDLFKDNAIKILKGWKKEIEAKHLKYFGDHKKDFGVIGRFLMQEKIEKNSDWGNDWINLKNGLREIVRYVAYFKFVHPDENGDLLSPIWKSKNPKPEKRMDLKSFNKIIDEHFTRYYPYEHFDRPQVKTKRKANGDKISIYDQKIAQGRLNEIGKILDKDKESKTFRVYNYIRNNIQVNAAWLAEIDYNWAQYVFNPNYTKFKGYNSKPQEISDENIDFNLYLAQLGRTLHSLEDFFAHTTFIDKCRADENLALPPSFFEKFDWRTDIDRRLKKWEEKLDEENLKEENDLVSGYFDLTDLFISLSKKLDSLIGFPGGADSKTIWHRAITAKDDINDVFSINFIKLFDDTCKFISNPEEELEDEDNYVTQHIKGKHPDFDNLIYGLDSHERLEEILNAVLYDHTSGDGLKKENPFFGNVPKSIRETFRNAVSLFCRAYGAYNLGTNIYQSITEMRKFAKKPKAYIGDLIVTKAFDYLFDHVCKRLNQKFFSYLGADRIGCHSLIAKDNDSDLYYEDAENAAIALDNYIIFQLTRHGRLPFQDGVKGLATKSGPAARYGTVVFTPMLEAKPQDIKKAAIHIDQGIDWLELLEYFLDNPYSFGADKVGFTIELKKNAIYRVKEGDTKLPAKDALDRIAEKSRSTNSISDLNWRHLIKANFEIDHSLSDKEAEGELNIALESGDVGTYNKDKNQFYLNAYSSIIIPGHIFSHTGYVTRRKINDDFQRNWIVNILEENGKWNDFYKIAKYAGEDKDEDEIVKIYDKYKVHPAHFHTPNYMYWEKLPTNDPDALIQKTIKEQIAEGHKKRKKMEKEYNKGDWGRCGKSILKNKTDAYHAYLLERQNSSDVGIIAQYYEHFEKQAKEESVNKKCWKKFDGVEGIIYEKMTPISLGARSVKKYVYKYGNYSDNEKQGILGQFVTKIEAEDAMDENHPHPIYEKDGYYYCMVKMYTRAIDEGTDSGDIICKYEKEEHAQYEQAMFIVPFNVRIECWIKYDTSAKDVKVEKGKLYEIYD